MNKLPLIIFFFIMTTALCSSMCSYRSAEIKIEEDVNNALEQTLAQMPGGIITADTIRCYRRYITITELKDTAGIAIRTVRRGNKQETEMVAQANCNITTIFRLSDQRASGTLLFIGILWLLGSIWYTRRYKPELLLQAASYGGIVYVNDKFMTKSGKQIRLTPMQHSLLEMFMNSADHTLTKQEICSHLWPNKPDASDTLYTLIKRTKPIIEANSSLKIESDRGKSYSLGIK